MDVGFFQRAPGHKGVIMAQSPTSGSRNESSTTRMLSYGAVIPSVFLERIPYPRWALRIVTFSFRRARHVGGLFTGPVPPACAIYPFFFSTPSFE